MKTRCFFLQFLTPFEHTMTFKLL